MTWQWRSGYPLPTEFCLLARNCITNSSQGTSWIQNRSSTVLQADSSFSLVVHR